MGAFPRVASGDSGRAISNRRPSERIEKGSEMSKLDLSDKVAIITGSSSGIGEAIARAFAAKGGRVVVNSRSSISEGEALADELPGAIYVQADIAKEEDRERLLATAKDRLGRIDHLVNNAGTTVVVPHEDLFGVTETDFRRILDVNLIGTWDLSRRAVPHLREGHGSILNVTSIAGTRPVGSSIPYSVSKAALNQLTELMAKVVGPEVRVNALAPGLIETPWTADWDAQHENVARTAPLQRSGTPEDMAHAAIALLESPYVTGQVLVADGGLTLRI